MGKAANSTLNAVLAHLDLPLSIAVTGVLVAPFRPEFTPSGFTFFAGGHPLPNEASFAAAKAILSMLEEARSRKHSEECFCLFLLSGGASAMVDLPLDRRISLEEAIRFHRALVHSGASITEINTLRKHFSAVKGGRLSQACGTIPHITLAISDVPAGALDTLGSGPTLPDRSTVDDCRALLKKYRLLEVFSPAVRDFFQSATPAETPGPGQIPDRICCVLHSEDLAQAARRRAAAMGFYTEIDNTSDDWNYAEAADFLLARFRQLRALHGRVCLVSAGEVTVALPPTHVQQMGKGGRNQHFALYAVTRMNDTDGASVVLSAGSDGVDGNSPAAGAVLSYEVLRTMDETRSAALRAGANGALSNFDSFTWLKDVGGTIKTGPTGQNLRDLRLLLSG